jgi:hypothetical protein
LGYVADIWDILRTFGIFYGHLGYLRTFGTFFDYIFGTFCVHLVYFSGKSGDRGPDAYGKKSHQKYNLPIRSIHDLQARVKPDGFLMPRASLMYVGR